MSGTDSPGFQLSFSKCSSLLDVSTCFLTETIPGLSLLKVKWWYSLIEGIVLKCGAKNSFQLHVGTITDPSAAATSWARLHLAKYSTVALMSCKDVMLVRLCSFLNSPKHQSGLNLVCPTMRKRIVMHLWRRFITRHIRYCIMHY